MTNTSNGNLPAYTTVENLLLLIDTLKRKNKESDVKAIFSKGESAYTNTKSALRTFEIIGDETLEFTAFGRQIAYSQESDKVKEMTKILVNYAPYEVFLLSIISKDDITKTEISDLVNFWGKSNNGSTERNREDAAKLFMSLIGYCGMGKYVIGRGKNSTRIEWCEDIKDRIQKLSNQYSVESNIEKKSDENIIMSEQSEEKWDENNNGNSVEEKKPLCMKQNNEHIEVVSQPVINININMSDWSDEKIRSFFKYVYGQFDEEGKI